jgi:hypothetical protein
VDRSKLISPAPLGNRKEMRNAQIAETARKILASGLTA